MSPSDRRLAAGAGAAACAVCCAGPIVGALTAIGLTSLAGALWFGVGALVVGLAAGALLIARRRRRDDVCAAKASEPVAVALGPRAEH